MFEDYIHAMSHSPYGLDFNRNWKLWIIDHYDFVKKTFKNLLKGHEREAINAKIQYIKARLRL
jgi:hypothetical protein